MWVKAFLRDPAAMFPGKRQMVQYDFTDAEIDQVVAFLTWIGEIDTNGFPKKPDMTTAGLVAANAAVIRPATTPTSPAPTYFSQVCQACHSVGGTGGAVGPALDGVAGRFTPEKLDAWLKDPASVKPGTAMPNLQLDETTRGELVAWLSTLH